MGNQFKSKFDGMNRAKRRHVCLDCLHNQTEIYKACPQCGSKNRQYFMSEAEHLRGMLLLNMQANGTITRLRFQPSFDLLVNGIKIGKYIADSDYIDKNGNYCVEDVKGSKDHMDNISKWKMKHFKAQYGIEVKIHAR